MPVAERSRRPGATTTAFLVTLPTPCHGSAICTMLTPAISGFSGWTHGSCSRAARRICSPTTRELARLRRLEREAQRARVGDRVPHAAERDVDRDAAEALHLELRVEVRREARHVRELDALALAVLARAVTSTTPAGASSRTVVSGSCISTMPVSSSTVATQIVFEPDIAGYSVGSMMM